jgi:predicted Zn-dependent protease with MMP-like domain
VDISDQEFSSLIDKAMDELPQQYIKNMKNVAVTYQDWPDEHQRQKILLRNDQTLFGLYEGIPLTKRGAGYNLVLPDKITIFKYPILGASADKTQLKAQIKHTLWHEIAHHFGLDHNMIHDLEQK